MKTLSVLGFFLGAIMAVNAPAATPARPAAKGSADKQEKKEEPAKIEGMEIARGSHGFLGLQIVNGTFKMSFYDAKKKPVAPDVAQAVLRWDAKIKAPPERVVLVPGGGANTFISEKIVRPPYSYKLTILLLPAAPEGTEPVAEVLNVDFRQE